jgi:hypothetical protein
VLIASRSVSVHWAKSKPITFIGIQSKKRLYGAFLLPENHLLSLFARVVLLMQI